MGRSGDRMNPDVYVQSHDGARLAVWTAGSGPPIVLVHGSFGDHTAWQIPLEELRRHFASYAMDRRGYGASTDVPQYAIDLEFQDVAAVVEVVANRTGEPVVLWGHSFGANCTMGGAALANSVSHLILYEPSLGLPYPDGVIDAAEAALERGDIELVLRHMLFDILEMTADEIQALRDGPRWPVILAGAGNAPREGRVEQSWTYLPGQFDGATAPTLLLLGSDSPDDVVGATHDAAAALPNATIEMLEGHGHFAHRTDPELVVEIIREFVASSA